MIVYYGGTRYEGRAGTDRHITDRLAHLAPIIYVEPPVSVLTPLRNREYAAAMQGPALVAIRPNLWRLTPRVLPGAQRRGMHRITAVLTRYKVRRAAASLGHRVTAVVVAGYEDLLGGFPGARTLFYATDDLVAGATLIGLPTTRLLAGERRQLARADEVAVVSPALADRFQGFGREAVVVPNGCAPEVYAGVDDAPWPGDVPSFDRPAAGFVGVINARIELRLLEAVADRGHPLLLVGPLGPSFKSERFHALIARPNVCWVGAKPFEELPSYLRLIRVGLTPYVIDAFNRASFPLKTLEYLAAGRAAVSTGLPATGWLRSSVEGAELIHEETSVAGFVRAVEEELAAEPTEKMMSRRRAFVAGHTWERRAESIAVLLGVKPVPGAFDHEQEAGQL